jgi:hypothetical protein
MGFFTWRATKQTKAQVQALRRDQALQTQQHMAQAAAIASEGRENELFQQLPPEGKAEFRAVQDAYDQQWRSMSGFARVSIANGQPNKQARAALEALAKGKEAVFRKYDLIA